MTDSKLQDQMEFAGNMVDRLLETDRTMSTRLGYCVAAIRALQEVESELRVRAAGREDAA